MFRRFVRYAGSQSIAILALIFALGGTAGAAAVMWTGANVVDGSLTGADVQNSSLTGADIQSGSITSQDLAPGSVSGGGSIVVGQIDDTTTHDLTATTATYGPSVDVVSTTFTTTTGKFLSVVGQVAATADANSGCQTSASTNPVYISFAVRLDGDYVADAGEWEGDHFYNDRGNLVTGPQWVDAGTHTLSITYRPAGCGDGNPGDPTPTSGQLHVSSIHAVAYSVSG